MGSAKEAKEFDSLPPEEAERRLKGLLVKMDWNGDEEIDKEELRMWIVRSFRSLSAEDSKERFVDNDVNKDGSVSWDEYVKEEFGFDDDDDEQNKRAYESAQEIEAKMAEDPNSAEEYNMLMEDKTLFEAADLDGNGMLTETEFLSFSHPEEDPRMHRVVVKRVLDEKDADKDGKISFKEYLGKSVAVIICIAAPA